MVEYISRDELLKLYVDGKYDTAEYHVSVPVIIQNIKDIPAADVLPRDEAIKMGAELAAMHGSDATSQQLEEVYLKGVEYGMTRRDVRPVPEGGIGEMSDGYHTFNGLYYQRMVLFASLVNAHQDKAWKSWKHEDGKPCFDGGWFIVGIDTPQGSYTYHYEDKYWNWFECEELPVAKHWDGHTEEDVTRLMSLDVQPVVRGKWIDHQEGRWIYAKCSECGTVHDVKSNFCPNCGADMREES